MARFTFDRYINGVKMAEGVGINLEPTLEKAMAQAARIARKGDGGETPVLIYRPDLNDTSEQEKPCPA